MTDDDFAAWLAREDVQRCVLVEATCFHDGAEEVMYLSDKGYISRPTDTPPSQPYDGIVVTVPEFSSSLADGLTGAATSSWGDIEVSNASDERGAWFSYQWDGRPLVIRLGDASWPLADFRVIFTGVLADIDFKDVATLVLKIRDKNYALEKPVQTRDMGSPERIGTTMVYRVSDDPVDGIDAVYDNNGPVPFTADIAAGTFTVGREVVGEISAVVRGAAYTANRPVPLCLGLCLNITPAVRSNTATVFQVHDGQIQGIDAVYDNGVAVTFTADLLAGTFTTSIPPFGTLTADVRGAVVDGVYLDTAAKIMRYLVASRSKLTIADIDVANFAAFDAAVPAKIGIYVSDSQDVRDLLDIIETSVGAWHSFGRDGLMRLGRLEQPAGEPVVTLTPDDWQQDGLTLVSRAMPRLFTKIGYAKFWTTQTSGLADVTPERLARLRQTFLTAVARADERKAANLLADEPDVVNTLLTLQADAQAEAARQNGIYDRVRTTARIEANAAAFTLDLGDVILIEGGQFGLEYALVRIIGYQQSPTSKTISLEVWL